MGLMIMDDKAEKTNRDLYDKQMKTLRFFCDHREEQCIYEGMSFE